MRLGLTAKRRFNGRMEYEVEVEVAVMFKSGANRDCGHPSVSHPSKVLCVVLWVAFTNSFSRSVRAAIYTNKADEGTACEMASATGKYRPDLFTVNL